jgi:uncharacterized protein DUF1207
MRPMPLVICALVVSTCILPAPAWSETEGFRHEYCGTNIPPDESIGFVPLPEGDVFCPLLADPKAAHSFVSYIRGSSPSPLGTDLASVGISDRFGLARWGGPLPGDGLQISLEGSVFAQFDLNTQSYDLINADYLLGLPFTYRRGFFSARLRPYHQSSHLGDEFVLRSRLAEENFAFEALEGILSVDAGPLRLYAGGEHGLHADPEAAKSEVLHGGLELRQRDGALLRGALASVRLIAAADVKAVDDLDWKPSWSVRAGFEVSRPREGLHAMRRWSLLGNFHDGPSPYGQFSHADVRYYGIGIHFAL